jgi:hypothetical protein
LNQLLSSHIIKLGGYAIGSDLVSFFLIPYFKTLYADGFKTDPVDAKHAPVNVGPSVFFLLTSLESE